jgi:hypothetical protein
MEVKNDEVKQYRFTDDDSFTSVLVYIRAKFTAQRPITK